MIYYMDILVLLSQGLLFTHSYREEFLSDMAVKIRFKMLDEYEC